jgi:putative nucleotidyltransferase with HDIG domain
MTQEHGQRFLLELPAVRDDLPFSPVLLQRLFRLTDEGGLSPLEAIAAAIAEDQGLSVKVLALANSAFYGLQSQVRSVSRAVAVLGLREIRALVLALGMHGLAARHPLPPGFDLSAHLEHQLAVAQAALALARASGAMHPDEAYTAGVLHDLGKLVTALYRPKDWLAQAALVQAQDLPWHEAESRHFGLDHGLIGAMVLRSWNLPESLTEPVNWHHAPQSAPGSPQPAYVIGCADACARALAHDPSPGIAVDAAWLSALGLSAKTALAVTGQALACRAPSLLAAALS